jgi:hypothetical protein
MRVFLFPKVSLTGCKRITSQSLAHLATNCKEELRYITIKGCGIDLIPLQNRWFDSLKNFITAGAPLILPSSGDVMELGNHVCLCFILVNPFRNGSIFVNTLEPFNRYLFCEDISSPAPNGSHWFKLTSIIKTPEMFCCILQISGYEIKAQPKSSFLKG